MKIVIPKEIESGSKLRELPETLYDAVISNVFVGESKVKQPKATVEVTMTSEAAQPGEEPTVGAKALATFSLQPQALWKIDEFCTVVLDKGFLQVIPPGDFEAPELESALKEQLLGVNVKVRTKNENHRTDIDEWFRG